MALKRKTKGCQFCKMGITEIDYKDTGMIKRYTSPRGKILSPKITGACSKHQRTLARAIKRARYVGLLPFVKV
ncbi:MAG: 30S ribosomal protein S18 [Candidatus Omnitrophica bacterium]|nr:30S ribosomal protein S18 [Candidatus Omnitrophota bacterium]